MMRLEGMPGPVVRMAAFVTAVAAIACTNATNRDVRGEMMTEAGGNYTYGMEQAAVAVSDTILPGPGGTLPTLTVASATRTDTTGRVRSTYIVARIHSTLAYPKMGIGAGNNYVWRDSGTSPGTGVRLIIIPQDSTRSMYFLRRDTTIARYVPNANAPQVVYSTMAVAACVSGCENGHCVSNDTARVYYVSSDSASVRALKP